MMRVSERFGGQYFKASHVNKPLLLTIKKVVEEPMQGDPDNIKSVVYFEECDKGFVLNVTNATIISQFVDDEMDKWPGAKIVLYATTCDFAGNRVDCLRVRAPKKQAQPVPPPEGGEIEEDDCPF